MHGFRIVIPARYQSSRFPGKVLADIGGKPMIQHVYKRAMKTNALSVVIATDDLRIAEAAKQFHADVCLTSHTHQTGTDRLSEVIDQLGYDADDIIVNVQADEPLIPPETIEQVANNLAIYEQASVATLCKRIHELETLRNPNVVKVVMDAQGFALYFSRSIIPYLKNQEINLPQHYYYQHIGLYAYRAAFVQLFVSWPHCPLEINESLEQLRVLWHGKKIHVDIALKNSPQDVNTEEDLCKVQKIMGG